MLIFLYEPYGLLCIKMDVAGQTAMKYFAFETFVKKPSVIRRLKSHGQFQNVFEKYSIYLISNQYSLGTSGHYRRAIEHFLYWMSLDKPTRPFHINELIINEFIDAHVPVCHCPKPAPKRRQDLRGALHIMLNLYRGSRPIRDKIYSLDVNTDSEPSFFTRPSVGDGAWLQVF